MEAVREASFNSSVITTLTAWRTFVERSPEPIDLFSDEKLGCLTPAERLAYDDERGDYLAELPALNTPILNRTVTKGLLFMRLNRGHQMGTPCGLILSGVPGVGKTTAVKALGRTVEQTYRKRNPQMADTAPVVHITMPTGQHPKALPAELLYFLGAPYAARTNETVLTHQACQLMTDSTRHGLLATEERSIGQTDPKCPVGTEGLDIDDIVSARTLPRASSRTSSIERGEHRTRRGTRAVRIWGSISPASVSGNDKTTDTTRVSACQTICRSPGSGRHDDGATPPLAVHRGMSAAPVSLHCARLQGRDRHLSAAWRRTRTRIRPASSARGKKESGASEAGAAAAGCAGRLAADPEVRGAPVDDRAGYRAAPGEGLAGGLRGGEHGRHLRPSRRAAAVEHSGRGRGRGRPCAPRA